MCLSAPPGELALSAPSPLDQPAQSVDQRLKMASWLIDAEDRGVDVIYNAVTTQDLDALTRLGRYDLTVVAAGKGELVAMFDRDAERSVFTTRSAGWPSRTSTGWRRTRNGRTRTCGFHAIPGLGELFVIPALTAGGPVRHPVLGGGAGRPARPLGRRGRPDGTRGAPAPHPRPDREVPAVGARARRRRSS